MPTKAEQIIALVTTLGDTYRQALGDGAFEGYRIALEDLTEAQLALALRRGLTESRFMPTPAELRGLAGAGGPDLVPLAAAAAWEIVDGAANRMGHVRSPDFGPRINAVVRNMGGWVWFCDQPLKALPFVRKEFERVFGLLANTPEDALHGEPLRGSLGEPPMLVRGCAPARAALPEVGGGAGEVRRLVGKLAEKRS